MLWKTLLTMTAAVVMLSAAGCTSPLTSLIRGQNPDTSQGVVQPAAHRTAAILYGDGAQEIQGPTNGSLGNADNGLKIVYRTHHHQSDHRVRFGRSTFGQSSYGSFGLVYPPQNGPPAVVQYPYYTVKGPTDFFYGMKESTDY